MTTLSVVIPVYNHWNLTHQVLFDLYKTCRSSIEEVLVVNDASTDDDVYVGLQWWKKQGMLPLKVLNLKKNHMFLKAVNRGVNETSGDIVIILSNDVRIWGNFCSAAKDVLSTFSDDMIGGRLLDFDTGWNVFDGHLFPYLEGWLIGCTRELWNRVGGFDERFSPSDYEDVDFSTTVVSLGGRLIQLQRGNFEHLGGQSIGFNSKREAITNINKEKFKKKWMDE